MDDEARINYLVFAGIMAFILAFFIGIWQSNEKTAACRDTLVKLYYPAAEIVMVCKG